MKNIKLTIEYDGTEFSGWQVQPNERTIQEEIEKALYKLTTEKITLIGSGRTDSGVHAKNQVANFKTNSKIPCDKFKYALNTILPEDISIKDSTEIEYKFHSRFDAISKKYRYVIYNSRTRTSLYKDYSYHVPYKLNIDIMKEQLKMLEGEHDFISFMAVNSNVENTVRTIYEANIIVKDEFIIIDLVGNGFLYNMVRIIVGTIIDIGRKKITKNILEILDSKKREFAGQTAPSQGLFLEWVKYS